MTKPIKLNKTEASVLAQVNQWGVVNVSFPYGKREMKAIRSLEDKGILIVGKIFAGLKVCVVSAVTHDLVPTSNFNIKPGAFANTFDYLYQPQSVAA